MAALQLTAPQSPAMRRWWKRYSEAVQDFSAIAEKARATYQKALIAPGEKCKQIFRERPSK